MQEEFKLDTIEEAIEEIRKGNFIIVVDDEDRENEGDLVIAAECITPEKVNFLETHARGLICAPITKERAEELELPLMVTQNTSVHATPFTVSIDLLTHGCTTGISAYDLFPGIISFLYWGFNLLISLTGILSTPAICSKCISSLT
jgi:3,4-dihydroxy 2-butanone 4-phosphate synthase/GTP cyclohydrolase II